MKKELEDKIISEIITSVMLALSLFLIFGAVTQDLRTCCYPNWTVVVSPFWVYM